MGGDESEGRSQRVLNISSKPRSLHLGETFIGFDPLIIFQDKKNDHLRVPSTISCLCCDNGQLYAFD
jgi:hypothetical protein